jgi:hypothetical protein
VQAKDTAKPRSRELPVGIRKRHGKKCASLEGSAVLARRTGADGAAAEQLESVLIRPKKADIDVTLVTLAFAPDWHDAGGTLTPAF